MGITKDKLLGLTFVITGPIVKFANRKELIENITNHGGQVESVVTADIDYLICNDAAVGTSRIKKAKSLGVKIISEKELENLYL